MGFSLDSDEVRDAGMNLNSSDSEGASETGTTTEGGTSYGGTNYGGGTGYSGGNSSSDTNDDFSDLEDTVYIANRYNTTYNQNSSYTEPIKAKQDSFIEDHLLLIISVGLSILGAICIGVMLADVSKGGTGILYYTIGRICSVGSFVTLLIDAIRLVTRRHSASLIWLAVLFPPAYYFKRCSEVGESMVIGLVALVLVAGSTFGSVYGGYKASVGPAMEQAYEESFEEAFRTNPVQINGQQYYLSRIFADNIDDIEYNYVPETEGVGAKMQVCGMTDVNGISQYIVITFDIGTGNMESVQFPPAAAYTDADSMGKVFNRMIQHTTPNTP